MVNFLQHMFIEKRHHNFLFVCNIICIGVFAQGRTTKTTWSLVEAAVTDDKSLVSLTEWQVLQGEY